MDYKWHKECIPVSHGAYRICSMVSYECSNDGPKTFPVDLPTKEDMYLRFRNAIENVNVIIVTWPGDGPNMTQVVHFNLFPLCWLVPSCPQPFPNSQGDLQRLLHGWPPGTPRAGQCGLRQRSSWLGLQHRDLCQDLVCEEWHGPLAPLKSGSILSDIELDVAKVYAKVCDKSALR